MGRAVESLLVLVVLGVLAWAVVYRFRSDRKRPGYANTEEIRAVRTVIAAAFWSLEKGDPRFRPMRMLRARVSGLYGLNYLDAEQVALIAPFIEQWLSGDLPHLLAPEYDEETRVPLLSYKARMQANGLWPMAPNVVQRSERLP